MSSSFPVLADRNRGTVSLVALCFVAVLGISLASYIGVCSRAMTLSSRSFQANLSQQLAEAGIEEGLRAFNKNNWSDWSASGYAADWTLDSANRRATATLAFPSGKFGQGATATVKIRVDNYDAATLGSTWSNSTTYQIGNLTGNNGSWYRSLQSNNLNHALGNLVWWAETPMPWAWINNFAYTAYDTVNYQGAWYRCHTAHTSSASILPTNLSYWAPVSTVALSWSTGTNYTKSTIMYYSGAWYYCYLSHTSNASITPTNTTYWAPMLDSSGSVVSPSASTYAVGDSFLKGDYIYRNGDTWYRCIATQPYTYGGGDYADTTKWVSSRPYISWMYRSGTAFAYNAVVYYSNAWYRSKIASANTTPTTASDWENALSGANTTTSPGAHGWSSSGLNYNRGDVVYYKSGMMGASGLWYRCLRAHTSSNSILPTNTAYWSNTPLQPNEWDRTRQYSQNDTVSYNGIWYLSLQNTNLAQNPATATSYWIGADTTNSSYTWNSASAYSAGNYRCYGDVWYRCTATNTNKSPNNTGYWAATGTAVVYAEATVSISNNPDQITQLRATIGPASLFSNAVAATTTINANSGGTVDSYDSTVGTPSSTQYSSQVGTSTNYSAVVAAGQTGSTAITLSSPTISGYLAAPSSAASPYAPLMALGTSTVVKGSAATPSPKVDVSRVSRSPSIPQFDTLPSGGLSSSWSSVPLGTALALSTTINLGTPGATAPSRYYYNGNLTLGGGATVTTININGPVVLYINGDLTLNGTPNGLININSTGSAEIHLADSLNVTVGSDGINNQTLDPKKLILICDTSSSSSQFYSDGGVGFYGLIYIPNTTNASGFFNDNNNVQIYGAVSANKITYSGANMNVHYDTSLRYASLGGVDQPYAVTDWRKLPVTEQATMP